MLRLLPCLLCALVTTSCASMEVGTPSGRPEILITDGSREEVHNELVTEFAAAGFYVADQNDYSLLFAKNADDMGTQLFFGSAFNGTPQWRVRCTTTDREEGVFVTGAVQIVTNPGSGFESATDTSRNSKSAVQVQHIFARVQARMRKPEPAVGPAEEAVAPTTAPPGESVQPPAEQTGNQ